MNQWIRAESKWPLSIPDHLLFSHVLEFSFVRFCVPGWVARAGSWRGFPCLIAPALEIGPRRRTNRSGIELREPDSFVRESVDARGFVERIAVAAEVGPPEVIRQNQNDIGRTRRFCGSEVISG